MVQPRWKRACQFFKKLNKELSYDPAAPLLSMDPKALKAETRTDTCAHVFIPALITTPKDGNSPNLHQQMNGHDTADTHSGLQASLKKEWDSDTCHNTDEP